MKLVSTRKGRHEVDGVKFSKKIVIFCITFIVLYTVVSMWLNYDLEIEISPTLTTCVYAFFGTELASMAIIRIFDKKPIEGTIKKEEYNVIDFNYDIEDDITSAFVDHTKADG